MKNKPLILIIGGILILIVGFIILSRFSTPPAVTQSTSDITKTLLSNANVTLPQLDPSTTVKLTGVTTEFSPFADQSSSAVGTVTLVGDAVGNKDIVYAILAINAGGSGTFYYLTAFENTPNGYVAKGYEALGDRIKFETLQMSTQDTVSVAYLTHGPTQSMADTPDQKIQRTYTYSNGMFSKSGGN